MDTVNEIGSEIEQPSSYSFTGDLTANWHPMVPEESELTLTGVEDTGLLLDDIRAGLEVENAYSIYGKSAFKSYDEYRQHRLGTNLLNF